MRELPFILILALQAGAAAALWPHLPDQVPTHWDLHGTPDSWASRAEGVAIPLILSGAAYLLMRVLPRFDRTGRLVQSLRVYIIARLAITLMLALTGTAALAAAAGAPVRIDQAVPALMSALVTVIGNGLGKIRQNAVFGIRIPATRHNPVVWQRTHRFAGPVWVMAGLTGLAASGFGGAIAGVTLCVVLLTAVALPVGYALRLSAQLRRQA